jgi:hypothetical protein
MAVSYTCPNPDCGVTLKTPHPVQPGKSVKCPKCNQPFVPETAGEVAKEEPITFKLADEPAPAKRAATPAKPNAVAKTPPKAEPPKPPPPSPKKSALDDEDDDESVKRGYGVIDETEEEKKEAEKNKPKFTEVQDKFKKSARGPAQAMLVMPSNLLTAEGLITMAGGIVIFLHGMWPLVFNDAPPGDEETEEAFQEMALGLLAFVWGALVCYGASMMQELGSYTWAMVGSVLGVVPILVGIFGIVMLQNPKVKAGFEEGEGGPDEDEEEDKKKDDDDDEEDDEEEDDDDEEEEEEEKPKKKSKAVKRKDEDEDDEEEDEKPKKKAKRSKPQADDD